MYSQGGINLARTRHRTRCHMPRTEGMAVAAGDDFVVSTRRRVFMGTVVVGLMRSGPPSRDLRMQVRPQRRGKRQEWPLISKGVRGGSIDQSLCSTQASISQGTGYTALVRARSATAEGYGHSPAARQGNTIELACTHARKVPVVAGADRRC